LGNLAEVKMSFASQSTETKIENFMSVESASGSFMSALALLRGIRFNESTLSRMRKGIPLGGELDKQMRALILELEAFRDATSPLPIYYYDARKLNELLEAFKQGRLNPVVIEDFEELDNSSTVEM
jgi:hypothetical protein